MANPRMTLLDLLSKAEQGADPDFLRDGLKLLAQELMDAEVTQLVGAGLHERSDSRLTYRNGYRERDWDTPSRHYRARHPQAAEGELLPEPARAAAPPRAGAAFGGPRGLRPRRQHPISRRPSRGAGPEGHLQGPGQPDLQGARRPSPRLSDPPARRR